MIDHPDLSEFKEAVQRIRMKTGWKTLSGGHQLPPAMQLHLDSKAQTLAPPKNVLKRRAKPSSIQKLKRSKPSVSLVPEVSPPEVEFFGCSNTHQGFRTVSWGNPSTFSANVTRVMCTPLAERRFSYRATFSITHGLNGKPMDRPVLVSTPTLRTSRDKLDVMELIRVSLMNLSFGMYVRIMSRMRKTMFMSEAPVDDELNFDPRYMVIDPRIPEKVSETFFPLEKNVDGVVRQLCRANNVEYIDPTLFRRKIEDESTSSSCDE